METSTLFLTRSDDDRGLERSPGPHAWGTRAHIFIPRRSVAFARGHGHLSRSENREQRMQGSIIQPSSPTARAIYLPSPGVSVRSCLCMLICC